MWTRKQYMDGECSHRTYYAQFVTAGIRDSVRRWFTVERLARTSDQQWFNSIPLIEWDRLSSVVPRTQLMRDAGEGYSLATAVCILKEAGRLLVEEHRATEAA